MRSSSAIIRSASIGPRGFVDINMGRCPDCIRSRMISFALNSNSAEYPGEYSTAIKAGSSLAGYQPMSLPRIRLLQSKVPADEEFHPANWEIIAALNKQIAMTILVRILLSERGGGSSNFGSVITSDHLLQKLRMRFLKVCYLQF